MLRDKGNPELLGRYSSFHSVEQTLGQVVEILIHSERLKRLLYYTDKQALNLPKLRTDQTIEVMRNQIKIVPKLDLDPNGKPYVVISLDNFTPDGSTTYYRDFQLQFDIICPYEFWPIGDFKLRPYAIAGEIDALVNKSNIQKAGISDFVGAKFLPINNDIGGVSLYYFVSAVGTDARIHAPEKSDAEEPLG